MAITPIFRALLIVGLLACLAASTAHPSGPNPEPLDLNYNIPYKPDDYDREALDKARVKVSPQITSLPSKRQEGIKFYSCGGGHKRQEHGSCGCSSGRKHSPPTKRRNTSMCGRDLDNQPAQPTNLPEHNCCGCNAGRKHKPPTKRHENNSSAIASEAKLPYAPVELHPTYPGSDIAVPASELEVLKEWAAKGKYISCNSGMKDKLPKRDHLEMYPTYPGSDLAVPASELKVLKQWAAEGKHPEITGEMNKHHHPLSKRLPPSFESFEELKKHREEIKKQKEQLSREKALQEGLESYENERIAAIADVDVKIQQTRVPDEDGDLPVVIKITITNNSKWKITYCDKTSPISSNAYKMGFFEVISRELRADIGAPANSTLAATQPSWGECSRDLYSGESASTWMTFPPPDALDNPKLGSLKGGKYDVRLTGVWHGIQAMGDPEVDPKWDTNEWSTYTHRFSSNTITIDL
ncbi:hypothetical protein BKA59DRAFT_511129 [Fusarium tricinctum]|uniref:Uncharacterized protein n=1 Tax=Fusarium tricinctum TaxID=61284 RepID=A0A8K0RW84_9HYPO|nr:hypothetical protein BKA59DRAFT_511129 [Fusarium tricinctum]